MHIISTFEHNQLLEIAINDLQRRGIHKNQILALPLQKPLREAQIFDTIHKADGISAIDGAVALGTFFMIMGGIYGFLLTWGPLIWGLLGFAGAFSIGLAAGWYRITRKRKKANTTSAEVVVIIDCANTQADMVEKVLIEHQALGMTRYGE